MPDAVALIVAFTYKFRALHGENKQDVSICVLFWVFFLFLEFILQVKSKVWHFQDKICVFLVLHD